MTPVVLGILWLLAAAMAGSTAVFVRWAADCRTSLRASIVVFLLLMMTGMLAGALVYVLDPSRQSAVEGLWLASVVMSASTAVVFVVFVRETLRRTALGSPAALFRSGPGFVACVAGLVLLNELLMGWAFGGVTGAVTRAPTGGPTGTVGFLASVVDSSWFLFTMAAEMLLTAYLLRHRLPRAVVAILLTQGALMALSPPALGNGGWLSVSTDLSSAAMIGLFVFLMEYLYRHRQLAVGVSDYLLELLAAYALMMAGVFVWLYYGDPVLFAASVVLEMIVFYAAVLRPQRLSGAPAPPWQSNAAWMVSLLSLVFVAELFMGAVLDVRLEPSVYLGAFPLVALSGGPSSVAFAAFSNGFWFFATVTASTWFLLMMGVEMGALVVFKMRESRNLENRVRLGLMLGAYGAFAVFYPSLYFQLWMPNAPSPANVPVLGWSMGVGSYPLALGVFGTILLTYVVTGVLTVLFGRRVICSVFCTAPLMYQGTTLDATKTFNRSSPLARKYLSSRFSTAYEATTGMVLAALVGTSLVSYFDTTGTLNVTILGTDPSVFLFLLSFSVIWYVLFVTIPYAGNYNCVTMGWCYTGAIAQAFQKVGAFKLKVRDRAVCRACTTLDCAKGCPIGLVDMPGHFRQTGEFRSTKCCGVGDCVEACPHDNLYIADIRHWVRRRLGLPETRPRRTDSPLVAPTARGPAVAVAPSPGAVLLPMLGGAPQSQSAD